MLLGVIANHALIPFMPPGLFWQVHADAPWLAAVPLGTAFGYFRIPAIALVSGYLLARSREWRGDSPASQLFRRGKRLLVPWLLVMLFWLVPLYWLFDIPSYNRSLHATLLETYKAGLLGLFTDHLWFLLGLFWGTAFWIVVLPLVERFDAVYGFLAGFAAALAVDFWGGGLTWFCLWECGPFIVYMYGGILIYRHREAVNAFIRRRAAASCIFLILMIGAAASAKGIGFKPAGWLLSCICCCAAYAVALVAANRFPHFLAENRVYRFFERNSFRYYLFHLPPGILVFRALREISSLHPALFVFVSFCITTLLTTIIVIALGRLEEFARRRLPALAARLAQAKLSEQLIQLFKVKMR